MLLLPRLSTESEFDLFCALSYIFVALILLDFTTFFIRHWPIFHIFFSFYHIITLLKVHILRYSSSKRCTIKHIKNFKGTDYGFNGFDTPFLKNLVEFFFILSS